jgi:hypothetical protein
MEVKTTDSGTSKGSKIYDDNHAPVTSILPDGDVPYTDHEMDADERVIMALGYKQEFKREFSLWTTFCVSFAVLGLLPSFASTLYYGKYIFDLLRFTMLTLCKEWDTPVPRVWSGAGSLP